MPSQCTLCDILVQQCCGMYTVRRHTTWTLSQKVLTATNFSSLQTSCNYLSNFSVKNGSLHAFYQSTGPESHSKSHSGIIHKSAIN